MNCRQTVVIFFLAFHVFPLQAGDAVEKTVKKTKNVEITAEEEKLRDSKGFAAIMDIHREMDDDHSGSIDRSESIGFMAEDMNMRSSDRTRREKTFHGEDDAITVDDLWEAWFESPERSWTTQELVYWLQFVVNLPQYGPLFEALALDGRVLPRLAVHNSTFMSQQLNVKSSVHRQKLRLSALDVVLFGSRENSTKAKDVALALLLVSLSAVLAVLVRQRRRAKEQLCDLSAKLTQLHSMQNEFEDVQKELKKHRRPAQEMCEIEELKSKLEDAHRRLENNYTANVPYSLHPLLRKSAEVEFMGLNRQKIDCIREMKEAIEEVDKLRKKQTTLLNSLKLATGASTGADHIDAKIFALKNRMESIQNSSRDAQERWQEIESCCGFDIISSLESAAPSIRSVPSVVAAAPVFYRGTESGESSSTLSSLDSPSSSVLRTSQTTNGLRLALDEKLDGDSQVKEDKEGMGMNEKGSSSYSSLPNPGSLKKKNNVLKQMFHRNKKT